MNINHKTYITFDDGRLGYIDSICTCEKCKERGQAELFIYDLNDKYLDCIKTNEVNDVIYIGENLVEAVNRISEHYNSLLDKKKKENDYLQGVLTFYCDKIIK